MISIVGWIGLAMIMLAFFILNTKYYKLFVPLDTLGTFLFLIHAIMIRDLPFICMNGFIFLMLVWKWKNGGVK